MQYGTSLFFVLYIEVFIFFEVFDDRGPITSVRPLPTMKNKQHLKFTHLSTNTTLPVPFETC
jgi:hypothetical protein